MHFLINQDFLNCGIFNLISSLHFLTLGVFLLFLTYLPLKKWTGILAIYQFLSLNNCKLWKRKRYFWTNILLCECPKVISSQFVCLSACQLSLVLSISVSLQPSIALRFFFYLSSNKLLYLFHSPGPIFIFFLLPLFIY